MNEETNFIIDTMTWSFSRLNSFDNCQREWYLHYIEEDGEVLPSFYAEYGSFNHEILEKYAKGELSLFDLCDYYEQHYFETVVTKAPYNKYSDIGQKYYDKGMEYYENIDLDLDNYEILGVEKEIKFEIGGYQIVGYIDLLLRDKQTGEITILDHKSATIKILKSGKVSKTDQSHFEEFKRQLYMYAVPILEEYGRVDYLEWNLFKDQNHIKIPFNNVEFEETKKWVVDTIEHIKDEVLWLPKDKCDYYCNNLCGCRDRCEVSNYRDDSYFNPEEFDYE